MGTVYSMTGFAAEKVQNETREITCELRSLNSRYLEISVKLPLTLKDWEDSIKTIIRKKVKRGKITCSITIDSQESPIEKLQVNEGVVRMYKQLLDQIRSIANIDQPVQVSDILEFKDALSFEEVTEIDKALQDTMFKLVDNTVDQLNLSRATEGNHLKDDLEKRLSSIDELSQKITELGKENAKQEFDKLYHRLLSLIDEQKIDKNRMEMELAIISDRVDISEEVVRLQSHIRLFRKNLAQGSPIGKKLNFILQEMHRESNTISSKNSLIDISHRIVTVKEEIERMREQVQNIE